MRVELDGENFSVKIPSMHFYNEIFKSAPKRRYVKSQETWVFPRLLSVIEFIKKHMPHIQWDGEPERFYQSVKGESEYRGKLARGEIEFDVSKLEGTPFKLEPYNHQKIALLMGRDKHAFGYFMDQGTGKTKVILDDTAHNWRLGRINCLIIVAPNSVKTNWVNNDASPENNPDDWDEVIKHLAPDVKYFKFAYSANQDAKYKIAESKFFEKLALRKSELAIFATNVEGLHSKKSQDIMNKITMSRKYMIAVDESTRIGNRSANRTKLCIKYRKKAQMARIASGTPVIKSPLKAYSQLNFLDENILNEPSYTAFSARYSVRKSNLNPGDRGNAFDPVMYYVNTDELSEKIAGCSYRVKKEDCLDLPDKIYLKRHLQMTPNQMAAYKQMREDSMVFLRNRQGVLTAPTVLAQLVRLQQITAGYLPIIDQTTGEQTGIQKIDDGYSGKVQEAIDLISDSDEKCIIWCKYRFEIEEMCNALSDEKIKYVQLHGGIGEKERIVSRQSFQNDPSVKVFVGQVRTGGIGITLHAASMVIYLSNTFSTEDRVQSEDRAHRIGQTRNVTYYDLIYKNTIDVRILNVLRDNKKLSEEIMKDGYSSWI